MPDFEVIVVGAGPAGAMMTLELAKRNFKVLCIERQFEVGYPNKSTAATPNETFDVFELPRELGFDDIGGFRMFGPTVSFTGDYNRRIGQVLKFRETKQYLIKEAIKLGAVTMLGTEVLDVVKEHDTISGVSYKGYEGTGTLTSNVVVDATGPVSTLATKLGLWKKRPQELGVALEYFLEGAKPDPAKHGFYLDFYIGNQVAPGGYAWIFGTRSHQVKAGICKLNPPFKVEREKSQKEYFFDLWKNNHQIKSAHNFEIHRCAHYITGGVWDCTLDGFIAIGDSVNKVNPIYGEGVRPGFYSARFAAQAIELARTQNDYSKKTLKLFDELWEKHWGTYIRFSKIFYQLLYTTNDRQLDQLLKAFDKLDVEVWLRLYLGQATKDDYKDFLRVVPSVVSPVVVASFIKSLTF